AAPMPGRGDTATAPVSTARSATAAERAAVSATVATEPGSASKHTAVRHPIGTVFWMTADDKVRKAPSTAVQDSSGLASEWASAESIRPAPPVSVLGPVRL